jgi:nucleotide-binding universal stress UspA family protein
MVDRVMGPERSIEVTTTIIEGHPAKVLAERAKGAILLVVGSRGFGGFDGLLLGSVSGACAMHAPCSVVIVRSSKEAA